MEFRFKMVLLGHKNPISALLVIHLGGDAVDAGGDTLVTASEDGTIMSWNVADGRCIAVNECGFIGSPRKLSLPSSKQYDHQYVLCSGRANEIAVLNSKSLEVLRIWGGHPDWIVVTELNGEDTSAEDTLLTLAENGSLNIWHFNEETMDLTMEREFVANLPIQGEVLDLIKCNGKPHHCLALTSQEAIFFSVNGKAMFNIQNIPVDEDTGSQRWAGAKVLGEYIYLWTRSQANKGTKVVRVPLSSLLGAKDMTAETVLETKAYLETIVDINLDVSDNLCLVILSYDGRQSYLNLSPLVQGKMEAKCDYHGLDKLWPVQDVNNEPFITYCTLVDRDELVIAYSNGNILYCPISLFPTAAMLEEDDDSSGICWLRGHTGPVTCMLAAKAAQNGDRYLISGGTDCRIVIWNLVDKKPLAAFTAHTQKVTHFLEMPEGVNQRLKGSIISVAADNSLAIISLDEMNCLFVFPGYPYPITHIQFRSAEDYLALLYADGTVHVWEMQSAHLDRSLQGIPAKELLQDERWQNSTLTLKSSVTADYNKPITPYSLLFGAEDRHLTDVFMINIANVVDTLIQSSQLVSPSEEADLKLEGSDTDLSNGSTSQPTSLSTATGPQLKLITMVLSLMLSWGVDNSMDERCCGQFGLQPPPPSFSFGLRGANGNLALYTPLSKADDCWKLSPIVSAVRLLSILSLLRTMLNHKGLQDVATQLITFYATKLPEVIGPDYRFPSLAYLSRLWQDATGDISEAARTLFEATVDTMSADDIQAYILHSNQQLPVRCRPESVDQKVMTRATMILGAIGQHNPELLDRRTRKDVALSLIILIDDSTEISAQTAAISILSRGFATWEPFLKASEVLRTLFAMAFNGTSNSAVVSKKAKAAVFEIAASHTTLFVSTLTSNLTHGRTHEELILTIKVITFFVKRRPALLYSSLSKILEAIVKALDPNTPQMREDILQFATAILHDVVRTYGCVDFQNTSQKLAVGTLEGAIVIYDLRTAMRSMVLEGHVKAVTAVSFSPGGKLLVSCSLADNTVRVWHPSPGILGLFAGQSLSSVQKPYRTFKFGLDDPEIVNMSTTKAMSHVHVSWPSERCVRFKIRDLVMSFNV
ncbi:hypothetical protein BZG36_00016 [Bifiguratus adelaidae]|uniref:Uncharacterized protein n=1 Tax=Bifiguratus adelaidae TaxID=1938954 RepID=A0A261Y8L0_9FUNG|nr:hypothetical protein BZG36_00016 [Bifiguratus adelaidae]